MPLPLYFAVFSADLPLPPPRPAHLAAAGDTFSPTDGKILHSASLPAELLLLSDRTLPNVRQPAPYVRSLLEILAAQEARGVMLDFERPVNDFCSSFLSQLEAALPPQLSLLVPLSYAPFARRALIIHTGTLCNSFPQFCRQAQRQFPDRWCLELVPWNFSIVHGRASACTAAQMAALRSAHPAAEAITPDGCCCTGGADGRYRVFDTPETFAARLETAQKNGCRLAIGLYQELRGITGIA